MSFILLFIDGVGLAPASADNPLVTLPMPVLQAVLGGPLTIEAVQQREGLLLHAIDATLGIDGLPQSGTGQMSILGGFNAAALHGHHQAHFPPVALRPRLTQENVFVRLQDLGVRVAFANVFGPNYWDALAQRRVRPAASVVAAQGAGLHLRGLDDLLQGRALCWDINASQLRMREPDIPLQTEAQAGKILARLAHEHDFVYFETFLPDLAAHGRLTSSWTKKKASRTSQIDVEQQRIAILAQISDAFTRIDGLLGALLANMATDVTLVLTSDHGNAESLSAPAHTRNPVPLLVIGPHALRFARVQDIAGIIQPIVEIIAESQ